MSSIDQEGRKETEGIERIQQGGGESPRGGRVSTPAGRTFCWHADRDLSGGWVCMCVPGERIR